MNKRLIGLAVVILVVLAMSVSALAFYGAIGTGSGASAVGTLGSPGPVAASAPVSGAAHITWTAVSAPPGATAAVTFLVERSGDAGSSWKAANNTCAGSLAERTVACDDKPDTEGDYLYRVTARYRSWTSPAVSNSVHVVLAIAAKLVITTPSRTFTAGTLSDVIGIERQSASGTRITTGSTTFSLSSSSATGVFRNYIDSADITSITIPDGAYGVGFHYRDTTAGTPTITASAAGLTPATQQQTVNAATAARLVLAAASTTQTAGTGNALTITAWDAFGNVATSYTGDKSLTFGGAGWVGGFVPTVTNTTGTAVAFGSATTITFANGVSVVTGSNNGEMKLYKAESALITVSDGSLNNGSATAVTVNAAPVVLSFVNACPSTLVKNGAGTYTSGVRRATTDAYGNLDPNRTTAITVTLGATIKGTWSPTSVTIAANATTSGATSTYTTGSGNYSTTLSASGPAGYAGAACGPITVG